MISYFQTRPDLPVFAGQLAGLGETTSRRIDQAPKKVVRYYTLLYKMESSLGTCLPS